MVSGLVCGEIQLKSAACQYLWCFSSVCLRVRAIRRWQAAGLVQCGYYCSSTL